MRVLYIAPLPPPITGHSIAAQVLLEHLQLRHQVEVVNLSEGSDHDGTVSGKRVLAVLRLLRKVYAAARRADRVYLTISESVAGNLKDLLIYVLVGKLKRSTVLHLHGGSFRQQILDRSPRLRRMNGLFLSRIGAAIVSGPSHLAIFDNLIAPDRIRTIPNFAQDFMFTSPAEVECKFADPRQPTRVLYISGMTKGKGYLRLLEAYEGLDAQAKVHLRIDFAGKFDDPAEQAAFVARIDQQPGLAYHGLVADAQKAALFAAAHVFCLPTSFMEGQPISILEAYASGCVVLSTPRPGILDIFAPQENGFVIEPDGVALLRTVLATHCQDLAALRTIALHNRAQAEMNFRVNVFCERVEQVLDATHPSSADAIPLAR